MKIWYMRDNHTFVRLPLDVKKAIDILKDEFLEGNTYGMLCASDKEKFKEVCHARSLKDWQDFKERATVWLKKVIKKSKESK